MTSEPLSPESSKRFRRIRDDHRSESAEDYAELILDLIEKHGEARLTEIAAQMGVSHPTAFKILKRLENEGIVETRPYKSLLLTKKGEKLARECRERHQLLVEFLKALGLDDATAQLDAEGIEHHVSQKTLDAMKAFSEKQIKA